MKHSLLGGEKQVSFISAFLGTAIFVVSGFFVANIALAADTGFLSPTSSDPVSGQSTWATPDNGLGSNDGQYAVADSGNKQVLYNFDISQIPANSTINGVEVDISGPPNIGQVGGQVLVFLYNTAATVSSEPKPTTFANAYTNILGGPAELWKTDTLASFWTPGQLALKLQSVGSVYPVLLDSIHVKIYYTAPVTPLAPDVTNDDTLNTVTGMTTGLEYKLDDAGYVACDVTTFAALNFSGDHTLLVRVAAEGINPVSADTTLTFTTNPVVPVTPPASAVSHGGGSSSGGYRTPATTGLVLGVATSNVPTTGLVLGASDFQFTSSLRLGMSSDAVRQLQERLRAEGYFTYPTSTGYFGSITLAAVKAYQSAHGIPATGFVGPLTIAALNATPVVANSVCPNGNTLASNCTLAPAVAVLACPNSMTIASNCTSQ